MKKKIKVIVLVLVLTMVSVFLCVACDVSLLPEDTDIQEYLNDYLKNADLTELLSQEEINRLVDKYLENNDITEHVDLEAILKDKNLWDYIDAQQLMDDPRFKDNFNRLLDDYESRAIIKGILRELLTEENLWDYLDFEELKDNEDFINVLSEILLSEDGITILSNMLSDDKIQQQFIDFIKENPDFKNIIINILKDDDLMSEVFIEWFDDNNFRQFIYAMIASVVEEGVLIDLEELYKSDEFKEYLLDTIKDNLEDVFKGENLMDVFSEEQVQEMLFQALQNEETKGIVFEALKDDIYDMVLNMGISGETPLSQLLTDEEFVGTMLESENIRKVIIKKIIADGFFEEVLREFLNSNSL